MRHRLPLLALVGLGVWALAGCAATPAFPVVEPTAVLGEDPEAGGRWIEVPVTAADRDVRITGAAFLTPYFTTTDGVEVGLDLAAGASDTINVPVGAATCPAGLGTTTLQLVVEVDGVEVLQSVAVEGDVFEQRNGEECGQTAITGAITPSFGSVSASDAPAVSTSVLLVRVSGTESVTLESVSGSEQFSVTADDGALPATLEATGQRLEVPVTIASIRCDGMPFGGATTAFAFSLELSRPGEDPVPVTIRPEGELLATLEDMVASCDQAPSG
ncbi:hypothetical protein [Demequina lignilytica]|uniref:Lipoprotein n=1 Tax=Demequina lignilytica TaxID=3051663 RepID=A0AB35MKQ7_9MICO|nr:hypothetical protein [Demequina sp. SYSU T0a273]MDN4484290.1 hypothetical protein [Demequina sp. SYSU T0a273]